MGSEMCIRDSLKTKLMQKFDKTLSDDLNPEPMRYTPMSIALQDNATPTCVTTARRVLKHFEPESKKTVTELLDRGVITPVNEATTWCSPAFFVPKADGRRVRLVTDFTGLNKFVRRPTHPFPSTREIIEAIPPEAKLFCKLDAVHGYFQLALDEKSSIRPDDEKFTALRDFKRPENIEELRSFLGLVAQFGAFSMVPDSPSYIHTRTDWR